MTFREKIDRAAAIIGQIAKLKKEYEALAEEIKAEALSHPADHVKLEDPEREGRRYMARGTDLIVPVVFTADALMKTFQKGSPAHAKIAELAGDKLSQFYTEPSTYEIVEEDGKAFRRLAREVFGSEKGPHFVNACLARGKGGRPKSAIKIEWEQAAAAAKLEEVGS